MNKKIVGIDPCQRCHNRYDAPHRAETRRKRKGQLYPFTGEAA